MIMSVRNNIGLRISGHERKFEKHPTINNRQRYKQQIAAYAIQKLADVRGNIKIARMYFIVTKQVYTNNRKLYTFIFND